jgi:hypothetical protein
MDLATIGQQFDLNAKLTRASKKFYKSFKQIKLIKQRISELITLFAYCDEEISKCSAAAAATPTVLPIMGSSGGGNVVVDDFEEENERRTLAAARTRNHLNLFKESIRQQIENLQCVKTAYFIYADRKADEIVKIQIELFGEERVREAYEQAEGNETFPIEILAPTSSSDDDDNDNDDNGETHNSSMDQSNWSNIDQQQATSSTSTSTSTSAMLDENLISA